MTASALSGFLAGIADGSLEVIDLTTPLSAETPALRLPAPFANLIDFSLEEVSAYNEPGPFWRHNNIHTGEHIGTHLDAPIHWISGRDGDDVSQIPVERLIGKAAVLDLTAKVADNPDYLLTVADVEEWESEHGELGAGTWLLLRTGWESRGGSEAEFLNADETGSHTPGVSVECAEWLATKRDITGLGVETVGVDAGLAGGFDPAFPVHYFFLGNDKYGLTSLKNLGRLPATGAAIVVSPLPIVGGTGSPSRVLAVVER
ncbi:cyclase family protein [Gordonia paraffinivorans]|uniref:Kynurenine formamidase n=2 Tax=Gordonia paraffinivorans TaxID=175628 RepID=A0ABD7V519_9ACTN|nr:cyclase family protein [Gordonia paraffinivorans]MBY4573806.1 cyclase [Gordonia paraffinivorans]PWD41527.1 cyclase [Gordonia paraffinivorans]VFA89503.1 Kynurenine formamidase [Gordonia paraffinivorans]